jgi:hypothetical protein
MLTCRNRYPYPQQIVSALVGAAAGGRAGLVGILAARTDHPTE